MSNIDVLQGPKFTYPDFSRRPAKSRRLDVMIERLRYLHNLSGDPGSFLRKVDESSAFPT